MGKGMKGGDSMVARMGRPPKSGVSRSKSLTIRLTEAEMELINKCSKSLGKSRTDTILQGVLLILQGQKK